MAETNPQGTKSTSASQRSDAGGQQARADQGTQQQGSRPGRGSGALQRRSQMPSFGAFGASPFALMRRMMEDLNRMFEDFGSPRSFGGGAMTEGSRGDLSRGGLPAVDWTPAIEAFERDRQLVVRADLPGLSPEDVRIEVTDDGLLIEGERRQEMEAEEEGGVYRSERVYGRFSRFLTLPDGVDADKAQARFDNGVLEISIPMTDQASRGRRIEIQGKGASTGGQRQTGQTPPVH